MQPSEPILDIEKLTVVEYTAENPGGTPSADADRISILEAQLAEALKASRHNADVATQAIASMRDAEEKCVALAAALADFPFPNELTNPDTMTNSLPICVQWRAHRFFQWVDARKGEIETAQQILADVREKARREGAAEELKDLLKGIGSDPELKAYLETKDVIASAYTTRIMARIAALEKVATSTPRRRTYGPEISADIAAKIEAAKIVGELRVLRKLEVQCELNRRNPADGSSTVTVGEIRAEIAALEAKE